MQPFVQRYNNQQLADNHGNYKGECLSLVKRGAQEVQNVPNADSVLYAFDDKAKNIYLQPTADTLQFYDRFPAGTTPLDGDIAVYDGEYGDVAFCLGNGEVFGQLGYPVYALANVRGIGSPIGYLRRKGVDSMLTDDITQYLYGAYLGREANQGELDSWRGRDTNSLVVTLVQSQEGHDYYNRVQAALKNPSSVKPYSGVQLFVKG